MSMLWRVRTTLADRPGMLADVARACGDAGVNIVGLQVHETGANAVDVFVVDAPDGTTDVHLAALFEGAGGTQVSLTRVDEGATGDPALRYLHGVHEVLEAGRDVQAVLADLLDVEPPDVADYTGHDHLELKKRSGAVLRIARAIPFTQVEHDRAQALLSLVSDAGIDVPLISPVADDPMPTVRVGTLADIDQVAALHQRCSAQTLYHRYQVPMRLPMTTRMTRRLLLPENGLSLVVSVGDDIVGYGLLERTGDTWSFQLLIEDAWQNHGMGSLLVKEAAGRARGLGAEQLTFVTAGANDTLLRTVGRAGFVARVERHDGFVHITVPLASVTPII